MEIALKQDRGRDIQFSICQEFMNSVISVIERSYEVYSTTNHFKDTLTHSIRELGYRICDFRPIPSFESFSLDSGEDMEGNGQSDVFKRERCSEGENNAEDILAAQHVVLGVYDALFDATERCPKGISLTQALSIAVNMMWWDMKEYTTLLESTPPDKRVAGWDPCDDLVYYKNNLPEEDKIELDRRIAKLRQDERDRVGYLSRFVAGEDTTCDDSPENQTPPEYPTDDSCEAG